MKIVFTSDARKLYVQVLEHLKGLQHSKFKNAIEKLYNKKMQSFDELPEYRITADDIETVLVTQCHVKRPHLLALKEVHG